MENKKKMSINVITVLFLVSIFISSLFTNNIEINALDKEDLSEVSWVNFASPIDGSTQFIAEEFQYSDYNKQLVTKDKSIKLVDFADIYKCYTGTLMRDEDSNYIYAGINYITPDENIGLINFDELKKGVYINEDFEKEVGTKNTRLNSFKTAVDLKLFPDFQRIDKIPKRYIEEHKLIKPNDLDYQMEGALDAQVPGEENIAVEDEESNPWKIATFILIAILLVALVVILVLIAINKKKEK